jgi:hypothetical protein
MLRSTRFASAAVLASVLTLCAFAAQTHLPTPSTWALNLADSNFGGGPAMKSDVFVMVTDTAKWAKYTDATDFGDGKIVKTSWSGPADGSPRPIVGMPGATYADTATTDTSVETLPDGTAITCNFSLTPNGKKFINKCLAKLKNGKQVNQTIVYDRTR